MTPIRSLPVLHITVLTALLGLTFGTHNCPGWSPSAYPDVMPEYSILALVESKK